jgi:hypothetical protein
MSTNQAPATVVNLRESKRESVAAKKSAPAKAPAKNAPAKAALKKQADKPVTKIRWTLAGEKDEHGDAEGTGVLGDATYEISRAGDGWKATVRKAGKTTVLIEDAKSGKVAWKRCVDHAKSVAA